MFKIPTKWATETERKKSKKKNISRFYVLAIDVEDYDLMIQKFFIYTQLKKIHDSLVSPINGPKFQ